MSSRVRLMIRGATGSGKTTELRRIFLEWVATGVRTDQILVLTRGASQSKEWRESIDLEAHGPIEAHSFFSFVQRELMLFWSVVQSTVPALQRRISPEFLRTEIGQLVIRGLLEPVEGQFGLYVKATPSRIAGQIAGPLCALGPALGLQHVQMLERLAAADRPEKAHLYQLTAHILNEFHADCLRAGLLDYGLSLDLFTHVLLTNLDYRAHINRRFRCLLVDDVDQTVPAEQDFIQALTTGVEQTACSFTTDGYAASGRGEDSDRAWLLLESGANLVELAGSYTCSTELFQLGASLAHQLEDGGYPSTIRRIVGHRIGTDLRGDLVAQVVQHVGGLLDSGVPPEQVTIISPVFDKGLAVTLAESLKWRNVSLVQMPSTKRLIEQPLVRAMVTLGCLAVPSWRIPYASPGPVAHLFQILLDMDPVQAAALGEQVWRTSEFPNCDSVNQVAYQLLRDWIQAERQERREVDQFVQMALSQVVAPLVRRLDPQGRRHGPTALNACQQLLVNAHRFRVARERFGPEAFGNAYVPLLTESSLVEDAPDRSATKGLVLATPRAYLGANRTAQIQIWYDISSEAWFPSEVRELINPHPLIGVQEGQGPWSDHLDQQARGLMGARLIRALTHRCTGHLVLAECTLNSWGQEQAGKLAGALLDLTPSGRAAL